MKLPKPLKHLKDKGFTVQKWGKPDRLTDVKLKVRLPLIKHNGITYLVQKEIRYRTSMPKL